MTALTWQPPGPVAQAFVEDLASPITLCMGPIAGGKTTAGLMKGLVHSYAWPPGPGGVRRVKFGVIRRLYKDLEKTTMKSWNEWFPRSMGVWRGAAGDPATHELNLAHPIDGQPIHLTVEFIALGDQRVEEAMRGWEGSFGYIDEVDLMAENTLPWVFSRCGRYPKETLAINPRAAWGTCNAPDFDSWVVRDFMDEPKPGYTLHRQPGGLDPRAENLAILGPDYYAKLAEVLPPEEKRRLVDNMPGISRDGAPVYAEYNDDVHLSAKPLEVLPGRPLIIGMDAGGTPAAAICQRGADGQWRVLAEITTHEKTAGSITGPNRFGETLAELLAERFRGLKAHAIADPSAAHGADTLAGEASWIDTVARVARIPVMPAPTNDPTPREEALRLPMTRLIDGRKPGLIIDPSCRSVRKALAKDYMFPFIRGAGQLRRADKPLKNWASHLIEALQYACLDGGAYHEVMARGQARDRARAAVRSASAPWNPWTTPPQRISA